MCVVPSLFSSVIAITEKSDMDLYEVPLSTSLLGFVRTMLANFHVCDIMLVVITTCSCGIRVQEGLCVSCARCLVCQDLVSCYFYFV